VIGGGCGANLACVEMKCEECGTEGKACCPGQGDGCPGDLRCSNQMCTKCGADGEACCRVGNTVSCNQGLTCGQDYKCAN